MPWDVVSEGAGFVVKDKNGKIVGRHKTKAKARKQQAAMYANAGPEAKMSATPHLEKLITMSTLSEDAEELLELGRQMPHDPVSGKFVSPGSGRGASSDPLKNPVYTTKRHFALRLRYKRRKAKKAKSVSAD